MKAKFIKGITVGAAVCALIMSADKSLKDICEEGVKKAKRFVKDQLR